MTHINWIESLVFWAGMAHFPLCLATLYVPVALNWRTNLAVLQPLLRQMFWTYAGYILVINCCFGVVSTAATTELLNGSFLAKSITLFIAFYWIVRVGIQFFYFDRTHAPKGPLYVTGEILLVSCFIAFSIVYLAAFLFNNSWI
jgi:hypothetical protein